MLATLSTLIACSATGTALPSARTKSDTGSSVAPTPTAQDTQDRLFGDPIVRGVEAAVDDHPLDQRRLRHLHEAVGHHPNLQAIAACDPVDLVLHRAGIGIDVDLDRARHGICRFQPKSKEGPP
jgi:hypothetical protein